MSDPIHIFCRLLAMACALFVVSASLCTAAENRFYVATDGNDQWTGKLSAANAAKSDGPFATLARARDAVRQQKSTSPTDSFLVLIRGGVYSVPSTLVLNEQDSGTESAPIIYKAFEQERPIFVGGKTITGWTVWKDQILQANTREQGFPATPFTQLLLNGERQHLARYPNFDPENPYGGGWAYAAGKPVPMYVDVPNESLRVFSVEEKDARKWEHPERVEVFTFARYNWWNNIVRLASFDPVSRNVTLVGDCSYAVRPGDRYYFQNALEELDSPGEWYLDEATGIVYFWPPAPLAGQTVTAPTTRTILALNKTSHVRFQGLTFECAEGTGISFSGTNNCQIAACEVRSVGDYNGSGIAISGGQKNSVFGCDVHHTGRDGISLSGGDRVTLTSAENSAENNYVHHVGVFYKQGVGIALTGVGNRATKNLIHDGPRMGIIFSGNNLLIDNNHIRHVNLETEDTGAVYTGGRDWISSRGTVIRNNYFHDILGYGRDHNGKWVSPHFAWGVYLDDNTGGVDVIGNVVARCSRAGIHLHNGRDNLIQNNMFLENGLQQVEYGGWTAQHSYWSSHFPTMVEGYEKVFGQPAWKNMRNMNLHPKDAILPDGTIMAGNVFEKNVVAWKNPDSKLFQMRDVNFEKNTFDRNLYWHFGQPIETGYNRFGRSLSKNLAPNPGFEQGKPNQLPEGWNWQVFPTKAAAAGVTTKPANGERCLRINAAYDESKPQDNYPIVISNEMELKPGGAYRLRAKFRATEENAKAQFMLQSYVPNAYFWASHPNEVAVKTKWEPAEFVFRLPSPGDANYHEQMQKFVVRIDFKDKAGMLFVDDVLLQEVEMLDGFTSWQQLGNDKNSLVKDPLFEDYDADNFRLKSASPAFGLGFKPIPIDQIGPYQHELRASWPITEAPGAREKPLTSR
ncbi:right-handed parallel beta-helix repeat-containing protein [Planctomicrobium piriforme]|uniref:Parallel beta-helix repeat (Two copies) n=1 Tax=Planctomicrobium piriforme TaxID=1576369 RepID=A0A1I3NGK4_9PLAN|nr:right-handed parallel beta-helix repeat-containing protein [Planctomicrobium piriforme]SFJ07896.1 parallel beta-helix repeat (two copies) [Planctomicrobium piriforme]